MRPRRRHFDHGTPSDDPETSPPPAKRQKTMLPITIRIRQEHVEPLSSALTFRLFDNSTKIILPQIYSLEDAITFMQANPSVTVYVAQDTPGFPHTVLATFLNTKKDNDLWLSEISKPGLERRMMILNPRRGKLMRFAQSPFLSGLPEYLESHSDLVALGKPPRVFMGRFTWLQSLSDILTSRLLALVPGDDSRPTKKNDAHISEGQIHAQGDRDHQGDEVEDSKPDVEMGEGHEEAWGDENRILLDEEGDDKAVGQHTGSAEVVILGKASLREIGEKNRALLHDIFGSESDSESDKNSDAAASRATSARSGKCDEDIAPSPRSRGDCALDEKHGGKNVENREDAGDSRVGEGAGHERENYARESAHDTDKVERGEQSEGSAYEKALESVREEPSTGQVPDVNEESAREEVPALGHDDDDAQGENSSDEAGIVAAESCAVRFVEAAFNIGEESEGAARGCDFEAQQKSDIPCAEEVDDAQVEDVMAVGVRDKTPRAGDAAVQAEELIIGPGEKVAASAPEHDSASKQLEIGEVQGNEEHQDKSVKKTAGGEERGRGACGSLTHDGEAKGRRVEDGSDVPIESHDTHGENTKELHDAPLNVTGKERNGVVVKTGYASSRTVSERDERLNEEHVSTKRPFLEKVAGGEDTSGTAEVSVRVGKGANDGVVAAGDDVAEGARSGRGRQDVGVTCAEKEGKSSDEAVGHRILVDAARGSVENDSADGEITRQREENTSQAEVQEPEDRVDVEQVEGDGDAQGVRYAAPCLNETAAVEERVDATDTAVPQIGEIQHTGVEPSPTLTSAKDCSVTEEPRSSHGQHAVDPAERNEGSTSTATAERLLVPTESGAVSTGTKEQPSLGEEAVVASSQQEAEPPEVMNEIVGQRVGEGDIAVVSKLVRRLVDAQSSPSASPELPKEGLGVRAGEGEEAVVDIIGDSVSRENEGTGAPGADAHASEGGVGQGAADGALLVFLWDENLQQRSVTSVSVPAAIEMCSNRADGALFVYDGQDVFNDHSKLPSGFMRSEEWKKWETRNIESDVKQRRVRVFDRARGAVRSFFRSPGLVDLADFLTDKPSYCVFVSEFLHPNLLPYVKGSSAPVHIGAEKPLVRIAIFSTAISDAGNAHRLHQETSKFERGAEVQPSLEDMEQAYAGRPDDVMRESSEDGDVEMREKLRLASDLDETGTSFAVSDGFNSDEEGMCDIAETRPGSEDGNTSEEISSGREGRKRLRETAPRDVLVKAKQRLRKLLNVVQQAGPRILRKELTRDARQSLRERLILEFQNVEQIDEFVLRCQEVDFPKSGLQLCERLEKLDAHRCFTEGETRSSGGGYDVGRRCRVDEEGDIVIGWDGVEEEGGMEGCDVGYGPEDLSLMRREIESGALCTASGVARRFKKICARLMDCHEGSVMEHEARIILRHGHVVINRFGLQHEKVMELEDKLSRVARVCLAGNRIGFRRVGGRRKENAAAKLKQSENGSLHVSGCEPEVTYMNYRDEKGHSVMGKRQSVRVFGMDLDLESCERDIGQVYKCHICQREVRLSSGELLVCANAGLGMCEEVVCRLCAMRVCGMEQSEFMRVREEEKWFCLHCQRQCVAGSPCHLRGERGECESDAEKAKRWCAEGRVIFQLPYAVHSGNAEKKIEEVVVTAWRRGLNGEFRGEEGVRKFSLKKRNRDESEDNTFCGEEVSLPPGVYRCQVEVGGKGHSSTTFQVEPCSKRRKTEGTRSQDEPIGVEDEVGQEVDEGSKAGENESQDYPLLGWAWINAQKNKGRRRISWTLSDRTRRGGQGDESSEAHCLKEDLCGKKFMPAMSLCEGEGGHLVNVCSRTEGYDWRRGKRHDVAWWKVKQVGGEVGEAGGVCRGEGRGGGGDLEVQTPSLSVNEWMRGEVMRDEHRPTAKIGQSWKDFGILWNSYMYRRMQDSQWGIITGRSEIHGIGLFTLTGYASGDMVIEYAGDLIRTPLGDVREREYQKAGLGTYLFKLNEDEIVDATVQSNRARFTNHSCDPNMMADVISISGRELVVLRATRRIARYEELTFDYKLPYEEDKKLQCLCNSFNCIGVMN